VRELSKSPKFSKTSAISIRCLVDLSIRALDDSVEARHGNKIAPEEAKAVEQKQDRSFDTSLFELRKSPFVPHDPTPRQTAFLMLECLEAFYGGAGGGGKSDALLMAALYYADVPGYNALIIRRNLPDLAMPSALMDRAHEWLGLRNDTHWDLGRKRWTFSSGATVTFGFLENVRDSDRYASAEFHFIGVDELTQFSEKQYLDLFARLRAPACLRCEFEKQYLLHSVMVHQQPVNKCTTCADLKRQRRAAQRSRFSHLPAAHIPLRMRSASNPGNVGHEWVKRRFIRRHGAPPGDRLFVPARLDDNPFINREQYVKSLLNLDPVTRDRILKGDWEAHSSRGVLKREWFEIVDTIPAELSLARYWDTAYQKKKTSDYTVGLKYGISRDGIGYILHVGRTKGSPHEVETFIGNVAAQDSRSVRIILQQEPGSGSALWIDSMRRGVLLGYAVDADAVKGSKFERSQPFRAAAEAGNLKLLRGAWNEEFLDECEQFSPDEREYEHDDQVDAACGAFNVIAKPQPFEYIRVPRRGLFSSSKDWDDYDDLPRVTAGSRWRNVRGGAW
jgi:predicted phage terminase large subunit-like protein